MRILIAAGGTAGHINPALAIAQQLKTKYPTAEIHFAGRRRGMEYALVTKAGYPFHDIEVRGIQRSLTPRNIIRNIEAVYYLALSGHCANAILKAVSPQLVIGTGGYVSGPVVRAAAKHGIKTAIHEQNAYPGVTNKLLAKDVDIVLAAMPDAVEKLKVPQKTVVVGNPVRPEVFAADRQKAREAIGAKGKQIVILSFGGSLGAQRINEMIAPLAAWHIKERNFLHIHATGSIEKADFASMAQKLGVDKSSKFVIREYIDNMPMLLAAADLVICRAGALTLAEISAAGKASVLIPSPNVAENHQYHNAMQLAKIGAATVIEEKNLTPQLLIDTVDKLTKDFALLMEMGAKARNLAMPNSLAKICDELELLLK
ncbi:MAG: undecaprenyldiphospho-muramoylpentapeptide beta-N-acetylglucosaminyltransferase [Oscillospiraceae bacterium]